MKPRKYRYFVADFETTVYPGQVSTEVWAAASVELFSSDEPKIHHSIADQWNYFKSLNDNLIIYYHNLKFDGTFWLSYFLRDLGMKQAYDPLTQRFETPWDIPNGAFAYSVSNMGQWYRITVKHRNHIIEFRDSLKLLPFSVKRIGESFGTAHKKLEMEYTGFRFPGCEITADEQQYIKSDVLVMKEALEIMFNEGHKKLTIGSCCLEEYRKTVGKHSFERMFPRVYDMSLDPNIHGVETVGDWIHKSYHGGWCYLAKGKEKKLYKNGTTMDVNSLYPSMMSSESGNRYPVGEPTFWAGNYIPHEALNKYNYYFVRIRTRFYLKPGYLPFIQIKTSLMYKANEALETTDIYDPGTDKYYPFYWVGDQRKEAIVELTLTMTDYKLLKEHYELVDFEILDGCYFRSAIGIFDNYIEHYKKIKMENKGAKRELAKLFLNNLYGKMASSKNSSFKVAQLKEDGTVGFITVNANEKEPGYIPVGTAITSYARNFTIRAAQKNYHGTDKPGFIYADTDSIHCDLPPEEIKGVTIHTKNFCCWDLEARWDEGFFVRQKTYVEHVTHEEFEPVEPYYNLKCAGMPTKCKELFIKSMHGISEDEKTKYTEPELEFLKTKRTIEDFNIGLAVPGKLLPKRIPGGVLLVDTVYQMR